MSRDAAAAEKRAERTQSGQVPEAVRHRSTCRRHQCAVAVASEVMTRTLPTPWGIVDHNPHAQMHCDAPSPDCASPGRVSGAGLHAPSVFACVHAGPCATRVRSAASNRSTSADELPSPSDARTAPPDVPGVRAAGARRSARRARRCRARPTGSGDLARVVAVDGEGRRCRRRRVRRPRLAARRRRRSRPARRRSRRRSASSCSRRGLGVERGECVAGRGQRGSAEHVRRAGLVPCGRTGPFGAVERHLADRAAAGQVRLGGVEPVAAADQHAGAERGVELVTGEREVVDADRRRGRCGGAGPAARRRRAIRAPRRCARSASSRDRQHLAGHVGGAGDGEQRGGLAQQFRVERARGSPSTVSAAATTRRVAARAAGWRGARRRARTVVAGHARRPAGSARRWCCG